MDNFTNTQQHKHEKILISLQKNTFTTYREKRFHSSLTELPKVRDFLRTCCFTVPGDQIQLSQEIQLIGDESFCNIVKHAYSHHPEGVILVRVAQEIQGISLILADQGVAFDPNKIESPSFDGNKAHGFGWFIICCLATRLEYTPKENEAEWNYLKIFKKYFTNEELMHLTYSSQDQILIITLQEDALDAKEAPEFKDQILSKIRENDAQQVILDMHQIQFIDSSGLGSLLSILRYLNTHGGDMKLAELNKSVRAVFELVSMHKIFEIFQTKDDALRSFGPKVGA